eukprot:641238-Prorocentrum_lima.AAC.1
MKQGTQGKEGFLGDRAPVNHLQVDRGGIHHNGAQILIGRGERDLYEPGEGVAVQRKIHDILFDREVGPEE